MGMETVQATDAVVQLTENAAKQLKATMSGDPAKVGKRLRVFIEEGGCSGLQYGMDFDEQREGDLVGEFFGVGVVVDAVSADFLRGTVVDFSDDLNKGGFKISNPQARSSCGCGRSFEA